MLTADGPVAGSPPVSLHGLIAARAATHPQATAVEHHGVTRTYRELDDESTAFAKRLYARGVRPGDVVAICGRRSPERVVAVLGTLKAGAAFLPLDPAFPVERLHLMLTRVAARIVVGDSAGIARLAGVVPAYTYDGLGPAPAAAGTLPAVDDPDSLAYVIFTSGSTGQPKGVALTHRGLDNVIAGHRAILALGPDDRVLQFAPFSFDGVVFETALAFGAGATLILAEDDELLPGDPLAGTIARCRVTYLGAPPSTLAVTPDPGVVPLATLLTAGEQCPPHVAARWRRPGRRFFNAYGPTETTIWATMELIESDEAPAIGYAYDGVRAHVLDDALHPVEAGAVGEIFIGGVQVARGYIGEPALTAERFVPDPFGDGDRLYRTGDLASVAADGRITFLGRTDDQLKVRGHRIEPGEIEWRVAALPGVRDAAVAAVDVHGTTRLAAFYVADSGIDVAAARAAFRAEMPDWMVPATFTRVDELPRGTSGKVDRQALATAQVAAGTGPPAGRPAADLVEQLCRIGAGILLVDRVGPDDDFFDIGGNSLLAAHFVVRLNSELGHKVPLSTVFDRRTMRAMADTLKDRTHA
ncbi:non-ribosomal peptide synthetase [Actinoplanes subglobosus]|uniref:Amino acid adenylation domain-containing protein n=1 Tax=Actinoplanes subglobosus TaxID=1547892 RepID=A0ABV8IQ06_9ACTN